MKITNDFSLDLNAVEFKFITSPKPGGQNVNKVATGVELRFNIFSSKVPDTLRKRLLVIASNKISKQGDLVLKGTRFRTQNRNREDVLQRLINLLKYAAIPIKKRIVTIPPKSSKLARIKQKKRHSKTKELRKVVFEKE